MSRLDSHLRIFYRGLKVAFVFSFFYQFIDVGSTRIQLAVVYPGTHQSKPGNTDYAFRHHSFPSYSSVSYRLIKKPYSERDGH